MKERKPTEMWKDINFALRQGNENKEIFFAAIRTEKKNEQER